MAKGGREYGPPFELINYQALRWALARVRISSVKKNTLKMNLLLKKLRFSYSIYLMYDTSKRSVRGDSYMRKRSPFPKWLLLCRWIVF